MSYSLAISKDFKFDVIFPNCMTDYEKYKLKFDERYRSIPEVLCNNIKADLGQCTNTSNFMTDCKTLIFYLDYVHNISSSSNIGPCCNYFNYILKQSLKELNCTEQSSRFAYEKINNRIIGSSFNHAHNICMTNFESLHDNLYSLLDELNELYRSFLTKSEGCANHSECYKKYMKLLLEYGNIENHSFHELLDKFKYENMQYMSDIQERLKLHESLKNARIIILTLIIIPFTLSMITFFLYKFTPYGLILQSSIWKIWRVWNRKNKDHLNIMDSSELIYNIFRDNKYKKECTSLGYQ
ncbi:variable surface protein [Plasmodium gonderi]|uniref:Variable surface protein n=1 Tax=Plasmodium gonderi TaxID=77519 RepID=A0A1Y1JRX9_PLAGO|nr:variable surface protein [Plasmodium gonderi]GAW84208.1 variable surface protein [Plasmodium gonderi]